MLHCLIIKITSASCRFNVIHHFAHTAWSHPRRSQAALGDPLPFILASSTASTPQTLPWGDPAGTESDCDPLCVGALCSPRCDAPPAMSFSSLPTVLVQLIMHPLDQSSPLSLARCNRITLAAANSAVAFRYLPFTPVCSLEPNPAMRLRNSLLRFCPRIHLDWLNNGSVEPQPGQHAWAAMIEDSVEFLQSLPPIHSLDTFGRSDVSCAMPQFSPFFQHLRVLRMDAGHNASATSLHALRCLEDITMVCPCNHVAMMQSHGQLPALRVLHLTLSIPLRMTPEAAGIFGACTGLRRLTLRRLHPYFLRFVVTERMHQLEEFVMYPSTVLPGLLRVDHSNPSLWFAGLSTAPQLRSVSVLAIAVDHMRMLAGLGNCASLHCLRLNYCTPRDVSTEDVRTLLDALPSVCRIEFDLPVVHVFSPAVRKRRHNHPAALCCRDIELTLSTLAQAVGTQRELRALLGKLCDLGPRISIVEGPVAQMPLERQFELRDRFRPAPKRGSSIC